MTSKHEQWRIPLKTYDSVKTLFDISVNTDQNCMGFESDTLEIDRNLPIVCNFRIKIWLKSYCRATENFGCSSINFQPDLCLKVTKDGYVAFIFPGYLL